MDAAFGLLDELGHAALSDGRGGWIGTSHDNDDICESTGADLWGGSAGIALTYAEAAVSAGGNATWEEMALHGARHALSTALRIPAEWDLGLLGGHAGVAVAALEVSMLLDEPSLQRSAVKRLTTLLDRAEADPPPVLGDVVTGLAGLALWASAQRDRVTVGALAERVLALAQPTPLDPVTLEEAGYAHGRAGAIHVERLLHTARLTTVDACEETTNGNASWCRGSAGIAMARQLSTQQTLVATPDMLRWSEDMLTGQRVPGSLCHGPLGVAAVLDLHSEVAESDYLGQLISRPNGAERLLVAYRDPAHDRPGLFAGRAGAAHVLLLSAQRQCGFSLSMPFGVLDR